MYWLYKYTSLQGARLHDGQSGNEFQRRIYRMYSILYVLRYFKSDVWIFNSDVGTCIWSRTRA